MNDTYLAVLESLEPVFKEAGKLAVRMRGAKTSIKLSTGIADVDIVTEADTAVQEFVLSRVADTPLRECRLVAEEATPSTELFAKTGDAILTLDPIDGTASYAKDGSFFSIIVGLHTPAGILYTFYYYPLIEWGFSIARGQVTFFGTKPEIPLHAHSYDVSKVIAYTYGSPEKLAPELFEKLTAEGYSFVQRKKISGDAGSATLFSTGAVGGYYIGNPIVYDGLPMLHFAEAEKLRLFSHLDMKVPMPGNEGPYYPGYYLALR